MFDRGNVPCAVFHACMYRVHNVDMCLWFKSNSQPSIGLEFGDLGLCPGERFYSRVFHRLPFLIHCIFALSIWVCLANINSVVIGPSCMFPSL